MIVILTHHSDQTSNIVIDWLYAKNIEFYRVNIEDFLSTNNTFYLSKNGKKNISIIPFYNKVSEVLKNNDKIVFWFRKWSNPSVLEKHYKTNTLEHQVGEFIENEIEEYQKMFFANFKNSQWLNNLSVLDLKKLNLLSEAANAGLRIPMTIVTTNKNDLLLFKKQAGTIITKPIVDTRFFYHKKKTYALYTSTMSDLDIENLPNLFLPTLFQEYIEKKYEIRTFMLGEAFFSMAIFSQSNSKTKIDFREYDNEIPNRCVPYILPKYIEKLLLKFSKKVGLNSGSFDLIKTVDDNYVFLEVNPAGQFGMVSYPCNYFLEEKIANHLIKLIPIYG